MAYSLVVRVLSWNYFKNAVLGLILPSMREKSNLELVTKREKKRTAAAQGIFIL